MRRLTALALGVAAVRGAVLAVNAVAWPRLAPVAARPRPRVSILVPARDEARNLPATLPTLLAQGADEVLVLDDQSCDGTGVLAARLGARVLPGGPLPEGWIGKWWACRQLADAATGDVLVFVDADVRWAPGTLDALLAELGGHTLVSVIPRADVRGAARALAPLVDVTVLTFVPYPALRLPLRAAATAHGATMAFRRADYDRLGGHALTAGRVLGDVEMARAVKAAGGSVRTLLGSRMVSVEMYRSYRESVRGFAKNYVRVNADSRALAVANAALFVACGTLPWVLPARGAADWAARTVTLLDRPLVSWVTGRRSPAELAEGVLGPVTPLLALPAVALALRPLNDWKGRPVPSR